MKAWELLESPDKWTKGMLAEDDEGYSTYPGSQLAVKWCVAGAIRKCYGNTADAVIEKFRKEALAHLGYNIIGVWNDKPETTHEQVVAKLKEFDV